MLELLDLRGNNLNETISVEIGAMQSLKRLLIFDNKFEGTIPIKLGNLNSLTELQSENLALAENIELVCVNRKFGHWLISDLRFKEKVIPGNASKAAPDLCTVCVISKGKLALTRPAIRSAPSMSSVCSQAMSSDSSNSRGKRSQRTPPMESQRSFPDPTKSMCADEYCIGRMVNDRRFKIESMAVSAKHCKIYRKKVADDEEQVYAALKDTSTNGTYHNAKKLNNKSPEVRLCHRDIISFVGAPHDENAFAFVFQEVHYSTSLSADGTVKRKADVGLARAMLCHCNKFEGLTGDAIDIFGTGSDGANTVNISTGVSILAAACGAKLAKQGNRSSSSACGSVHVLEALGVAIDLDPESVARCVNEAGIEFMMASKYHPAMKIVSLVRKKPKLKTVFNILGPMLNLARVSFTVWCIP